MRIDSCRPRACTGQGATGFPIPTGPRWRQRIIRSRSGFPLNGLVRRQPLHTVAFGPTSTRFTTEQITPPLFLDNQHRDSASKARGRYHGIHDSQGTTVHRVGQHLALLVEAEQDVGATCTGR